MRGPRRYNWRRAGRLLFIGGTAAWTLTCGACHRQNGAPRAAQEQEEEEEGDADAGQPNRLPKGEVCNKGRPRDVLASWYEVPEESLAKRRAGAEERTAADDRLPIGTLVEVTNLANGKQVRVRITDRGLHGRKVKLDLCKEAAEELDIVSKGIARVRMQVVEEGGSSTPDSSTTAPAP